MIRVVRAVRLGTAGLVLLAAGLGLLATGDAADHTATFIASWQFFPATGRAVGEIMAGFGVGGFVACMAAAAILLVTAVFGRWYCAALCPTGTLQDLASYPRGRRRAYARPFHPLRALVLLAVVALAVIGAMSIASWVDPWSLFTRFATYDIQSAVRFARREDLPGLTVLTAGASAAAMLAVLSASFLRGRWFCGHICPVGTVLGALNAIAPLRVRLETSACVSCGACSSVCRASCIDVRRKSLDATRCVNCLACLDVCPTGAIRYGRKRSVARNATVASGAMTRELTRSQFLISAAGGIAALSSAVAPGRTFAWGTEASARIPSQNLAPVVPPGAGSIDRFMHTCTSCGLCINRCPSKVLQPARGHLGVRGFMAPVLDYSISYCQYDCTLCMDVCPSGALAKLKVDRKHVTKIGDSTLVSTQCIVFTNGTKCGACAEHCPTGAVRMVAGETGLPEPVFTSSICIGCGACHHACPVRPEQAIRVAGLRVHTVAKKPSPDLFDTRPTKGEPDRNAFPF